MLRQVREKKTQKKQQRSSSRERKKMEGRPKTHPIVPQLATRRVRCPSGTSGGFEVEVVVDEGHTEARLEVQVEIEG